MWGQKFAKLTGLKYSTFAARVSKPRKERDAIFPALPEHGKSSVEWLETVISEAQNAALLDRSAVVVRLPSGAAIELANAAQALERLKRKTFRARFLIFWIVLPGRAPFKSPEIVFST